MSQATPTPAPSNQEANDNSRDAGVSRPRDAEEPRSQHSFFPPASAEPEHPERIGHYRVLGVLGKGGMGMVYHAEDMTLGRAVALKVIKPEIQEDASAGQRFLREARAMAAVRHDHLVTVYQAGQEGGVVYIAMELLKGESLADRLKPRQPLEADEIIRTGLEIAEGISAIHQNGFIHRDLKPSNIWLEAPSGRVKILDLGLARPVHEDTKLTRRGTICGTPAFMSPEQARGDSLDARSDLFSLGGMLYVMCTGRHPFQGENTLALLTALAVDSPRPVRKSNPAIPLPLAELVMQLLMKKPDERPASAAEVVERLRAMKSAVREGTAPPSAKRASGKRPVLVGGAAATLLAAAVAVLAAKREPQPQNQPAADGTSAAAAVPKQPNSAATPTAAQPAIPALTNSIGMKLVRIPTGKFLMGSPAEEVTRCLHPDGEKDNLRFVDDFWSEVPAHEVEITRPFYMGATEVTVGQFQKFVQETGYRRTVEREHENWTLTDDQPVINVSWHEAMDFCAWLSKKDGKPYRLPTEAEWEYACRAGKSQTRYTFGDKDEDLRRHARYRGNLGNQPRGPQAVGRLEPNAWGLYDMHGNAYEWCLDKHDPNYYRSSPKQDPPGLEAGGDGHPHSIRGGSWFTPAEQTRCAFRRRYYPAERMTELGFRIVCVAAER